MCLKNFYTLMVILALNCCSGITTTITTTTEKEIQSTNREKLPKDLIDEVKLALLPLFGFQDRPEQQQKHQQHQQHQQQQQQQQQHFLIPDTMKEIYQIQTGYHLDTASLPLPGLNAKSANTVRSFTHMESSIDKRFKGHHKFRLKFNLTTIPKNEKLMAAELKLKCDDKQLSLSSSSLINPKQYQRIIIHDIIKPGRKGKYGPITRVIDTKLINTRSHKTINFNVLPAVKRWFDNPSTNYGLLIIVYGGKGKEKSILKHHIRLRRDINDSHEDWLQKQPLLLTYTDDGKNVQKTGNDMLKIRRRRAPRGHRKGDQRDPCKRRSMYVNFQDVGWSDWIVAPLGFEAFYCGGECEYPMAEHMNTTNHAIVQSLMNSARPYQVPKPCCVPTQLSSMSMLYVDSQKSVILKNYKDMVVIGCGCR